MKIIAKFAIILGIIFLTTAPLLAQNGERILSYRSEITVHEDTTVTVIETIKVRCANIEINHGIYRDFPTTYTDDWGNRIVVRFEIIKVTLDGEDEQYHMESQSNGERVYIGSADVIVDPGIHTYSITYDTNRQLTYMKDKDGLYWNVTGVGWVFPIDEVTAVVNLPSGINPDDIELHGYTGPEGAQGKDFTCYTEKSGRSVFKTTKPFGPHEGLAIAVSWPKGFVQEPTAQEKASYILKDNRGLIVGGVGLIAILIYYILAWSAVGKDPKKGTIIPQYHPPDNLSPAAMRYITRMGYDNKAFAASVLNMAVKRYLKIDKTGSKYTLIRDTAPESVLTPEETGIAVEILTSNSIEMDDSNYKKIGSAIRNVSRYLGEHYQKGYFATNTGYFAFGLALSIIILIISFMIAPTADSAVSGILIFVVSIWSIILYAMITQIKKSWKANEGVAGAMSVGCSIAFVIPFFVGELVWLGLLFMAGSLSTGIVTALFAVVNFIFYGLLKAPTVKGRELLDRIEGFKLYMSVAEKDQLSMISSQNLTPELFERFLPYALALDVEQQWAERFSDVLAQASIGGEPYHPVWYAGMGFSAANIGGFTSSMGSSLSSAISSSSTAPGSSSGSGGFSGGGSSGGGGGGGGGGGW